MPNATKHQSFNIPIASMYGIFNYIYHKNHPNVVIDIPYMDGMGLIDRRVRPIPVVYTSLAGTSHQFWITPRAPQRKTLDFARQHTHTHSHYNTTQCILSPKQTLHNIIRYHNTIQHSRQCQQGKHVYVFSLSL